MALNELKTMNGHTEPVATRAWDDRFAWIERRIAELTAAGEQRVAVLRDAIADHVAAELATRDSDLAALQTLVGELQQTIQEKSSTDRRVAEVAAQLEERQARRDEAKRGRTGRQGERGARGERGPAGARGPKGKPAQPIIAWKVDAEHYRIIPFTSDGKPGAAVDLRPLFEAYHLDVNS